jgi:hypothetical protein
VVTTAEKTTHPFTGQGSDVGYVINGVQGMELTLKRGVTYKFYVEGKIYGHCIGHSVDYKEPKVGSL